MTTFRLAWRCLPLLLTLLAAGPARAAPVYGAINADGVRLSFYPHSLGYEADGLRTAGQGHAMGYINAVGQWVIPATFTGGALPFHNGRAIVWDAGPSNWRVIDTTGRRVADAPELSRRSPFIKYSARPGLLTFDAGKGAERVKGVITPDMKVVVSAPGDGHDFVVGNDVILDVTQRPSSRYDILAVYALDGRLLLDKPSAAGPRPPFNHFIDNDDLLAERGFFRGLAVRYDEAAQRYGYINEAGEWAIPPTFRDARAFRDEVALVVTDINHRDNELTGQLIDRQGRRVAKLPKAYCYATAENGRIHARLNLGGETYRGVWLNYEGDEVATVPGPCELRTRWVNPQLAVLGKALVRPDGKVVQNGEQPVRYESVKRVEPETGLVIVTADSRYAGSSPEETQRLAAARLAERQAFEQQMQLRRMEMLWWHQLKEPQFHTYWAVRLYLKDDTLFSMTTHVKVRDGRGVQDVDLIAATAGCRPQPGWKLVKKGLVHPSDRNDLAASMFNDLAQFHYDALKGQKAFVNDGDHYCDTVWLVDGPLK